MPREMPKECCNFLQIGVRVYFKPEPVGDRGGMGGGGEDRSRSRLVPFTQCKHEHIERKNAPFNVKREREQGSLLPCSYGMKHVT